MRFNFIIERAHPNCLISYQWNGPSAYWNILQLLQKDRKGKEHPTIINVSLFDLHVLHGAFKVGMEAAGLDLGKVLKLM